MNWIPITERLPERVSAYVFWNSKRNYRVINIFGKSDPLFNTVPPDCTHWLEITGPEDCCEWRVDKEYNAHTSCGTIFGYRNTFRHCPNFGRTIKEVK